MRIRAGVRHAGQAALRGRLDGTDDQNAVGHRWRDLRPTAAGVRRTGRGAAARRRGPAPAGDHAGHAQPQSRAARHRRRDRHGRRARARRRVRDDRDDGDDAGRPGSGGAVRRDCAPRSAGGGAQLRDRSRFHDRPSAHPRPDLAVSDAVHSQRRPARRGRPLQRIARVARRQAGALRRPGLAEHAGRLLRHHAGAHPAARPDAGRQDPAASAAARGQRGVGAGPARDRRRQTSASGGRTYERHRLAAVQAADRRRRVRGRRGDRSSAGARRRPRRGRVSGRPGPRRDGRRDRVSGPGGPQGQSPADDRLDRPGRDPRRAGTLAGQGHRQLDQPGRRRGPLRPRRAAAQALRRGRGGRLYRRRPAAGHGRQPAAEARGRAAQLYVTDREIRAAGRRPDLRSAGVPARHRRPELHRCRPGDDCGGGGDQARPPGLQDHSRHQQRLVRPAAGRPRGSQFGLPLPVRQGRTRLGDRQHREVDALRLHPRARETAGRGSDRLARRRPGRRLRRPLPPEERDGRPGYARRPAAGRTPGPLHRRGLQGRPDRRPECRAGGAARAGRHQRPAHGRHGRGRPAVQQQRTHRRRSVAERRGHEGRGPAPGTVHGEGGRNAQGHRHPGHGQGRRARHRQESGRDHPVQQRLPRDQPGHQGRARNPDRGGTHASARHGGPVRTTGEIRTTDGRHRPGPQDRGRGMSAAGRGRRADPAFHRGQDRARVRRPGVLRQRRDARAGPRQPAHGRRQAHRVAPGTGTGRGNPGRIATVGPPRRGDACPLGPPGRAVARRADSAAARPARPHPGRLRPGRHLRLPQPEHVVWQASRAEGQPGHAPRARGRQSRGPLRTGAWRHGRRGGRKTVPSPRGLPLLRRAGRQR